MKILWQVPLLLFVLSSSLFAQTQDSLETSGNAFLRICSVADKVENTEHLSVEEKVALMSCLNFISGFTNGVEVEMLFVENATKQSTHAPFCVPASVENIQIVRVVLKYIRDNPAAARRKTNSLIMFSLGERYPCASH
jgi:secreted Zn-dependent insulinase-like peptidase